ncbi:protein odr-4 homolog isoform X2 [Rhinatrema bivittatum]|uniref:protein odr-4 homolog isoform X2 n=1 Tax=Rhinatrema bivittatum TaxID=194408 RepID=UPI001129B196|nr:protein odr-4 homolog isoform X2 [Rhinatrema bivittatum]
MLISKALLRFSAFPTAGGADMGRSYFVEEAVGQYLSNLITREKACVTGLLIGQCSSQRDYIVLAVRTPFKEEQSESSRGRALHPRLSDVDEEWAAEHANQVSRMLPGGLLVLGVFIITSPELSKDAQTVLRKLVFTVEKSAMKSRLWSLMENDVSERVTLHLCSVTKKMLCRTYDVRDAKSSAKPADWKYQSNVLSSWLSLECAISVNIQIPLSATSASRELHRNIRSELTHWAAQIEQSILLINGQVKGEDSELLEGQKKTSRSTSQPSTQAFNVKVLMPLPQSSNNRSTAVVQVCKGSLYLQGVVKCRAYVHSNKPKVKDAIQALKRDMLNTISDRCEILFEDLILNGAPCDASDRAHHALPRRVFTPLAGSCILLCDYLFGNESIGDIQEHFLEMLDQNMQIEDSDISEETNTGAYPAMTGALQAGTAEREPGKALSVLKGHASMGVVLAAAVALLAAAFSLHFLSN